MSDYSELDHYVGTEQYKAKAAAVQCQDSDQAAPDIVVVVQDRTPWLLLGFVLGGALVFAWWWIAG